MKTRYLNNELKDQIKHKIDAAVLTKTTNSIPGKELKSIEKQIVNKLRKLNSKRCSHDDLAVLEKFTLVREHDEVRFLISAKKEGILHPFYGQRYLEYTILIDPVIKAPFSGTNQDNQYLISLINEDPQTIDLCTSAFKINDHLKCETKETVNAYMTRVNKFRTVKTLLDAHPDMKKFIPKEADPEAQPEPTRAEKLIDQFESL